MLSTWDHSRALTLDPWTIGPGVVSEHLNGLGYYIEHEIGDGPDEVGARLMDFDCENFVGSNEAMFIGNEDYDGSTMFSYDLYVQTTFVFNSSLVFFDQTADTGNSIGEVKFCVLTTTNMTVPGEPDIEIQFRRTKYTIAYDFSENIFSTDTSLDLPSARSCFDLNFTVVDIEVTDTTDFQEFNLTLSEGLNRFLVPFDELSLPPGYSCSAGVFGRHSIVNYTLNIPSGENAYFANVSTCVIFPCINPFFCNAVNENEMPTFFSDLFAEYTNGIEDGTLSQKVQEVAAEFAGLTTARSYSGMLDAIVLPLDFDGITIPVVIDDLLLASSLMIPALIPIDDVTVPLLSDGSFNETLLFLMEDIIIDSVEFILRPTADEFQDETIFDYSSTNFTGNRMYSFVNITIDFLCLPEGCSATHPDVVALLQALLDKLELDMENGLLKSTIDTFADPLGVTNFLSSSINGDLVYPTLGQPEPVFEFGQTGVANSSRFMGNHTILNVTEPVPSDITSTLVKNALVSSTMTFVSDLEEMDLFFICVNDVYGETDEGVPFLTSSVFYEYVYFCANATMCETFEETDLVTAQLDLLFSLNVSANNGAFATALSLEAQLAGVPELQYPTSVSFGVGIESTTMRRMLQNTDDTPYPDQPPITSVGEVSGLSATVSLPLNLTINDVVEPVDDPVLEALMEEVVLEATENLLMDYIATIPDGYLISFTSLNSNFIDSQMIVAIEVSNTFVCESVGECDDLINGEGEEIVSDMLSLLIIAVDDGTLLQEIQTVADASECPGFETSTPEEVEYPNVEGSNLVFDSGIEVLGGGTTTLYSLICIENVTQVNETFDSDPVTVVVQQVFDACLEDYTAALPEELEFESIAEYYIFEESNETGKIEVTFNYNVSFVWSYECTTMDECEELSDDITGFWSPMIVDLVTLKMDDEEIETQIRALALEQGVEPLYDSVVPSECFIFPEFTVIPVGDIVGIQLSYNFFDLLVIFDYPITACRCDIDLECNKEPVVPFDLFRICVVPDYPNDVFIRDMNMTITGVENNYIYVPVEMGAVPGTGPISASPLAAVSDLGDVIMVETYLTAAFYIENGGATEVAVEGHIFLSLVDAPFDSRLMENDFESTDFKFKLPLVAMDIDIEDEVEEDPPTTKFHGCFQNFLRLIGL